MAKFNSYWNEKLYSGVDYDALAGEDDRKQSWCTDAT